jgi:hypothetical protein
MHYIIKITTTTRRIITIASSTYASLVFHLLHIIPNVCDMADVSIEFL